MGLASIIMLAYQINTEVQFTSMGRINLRNLNLVKLKLELWNYSCGNQVAYNYSSADVLPRSIYM